MERRVEAQLATLPRATDNRELAALKRAVVHAAVEQRMLLDAVQTQGLDTHHRKAFLQGVSAAIDCMDITFKRHLSNVNPSVYAHALERSYEHEHRKFLEMRAALIHFANGGVMSSREINALIDKYPVDAEPGTL